jgi:hypothetical protein
LPRAVFGEEGGANLCSRKRPDSGCRRARSKLGDRGSQRRPGVSNCLAKKANRVIVRGKSRRTAQLEGTRYGGISYVRNRPVARACCGRAVDMSLRDVALESSSGQNQRDENASGDRQPRAAVTTAAANRSECRHAQAGLPRSIRIYPKPFRWRKASAFTRGHLPKCPHSVRALPARLAATAKFDAAPSTTPDCPKRYHITYGRAHL